MVCNRVLIPNKYTPKTGIPTVLKFFNLSPNPGSFTHPHQPPSSTTPNIFLKFLLSPPLTPILEGWWKGVHTVNVDVICVCDNDF